MSKTTPRFTEVAKAKVNDSRNIVLSKTQTGSILMAQQIKVAEGKKVHNVFLQGAIELPTVESLYELRDAINLAIKAVETN